MPIMLELLNGLLRTKPLKSISLLPKLTEKEMPHSTIMLPNKPLLIHILLIKLLLMPFSPLLPVEIDKMPPLLQEELMLRPMLIHTEQTLNLKPQDILPTKSNLRSKKLPNSLTLILKKRDKSKLLLPRPLRSNKEPFKLNSRKRMPPGEKKLQDLNS
jgi:hypothetical protein